MPTTHWRPERMPEPLRAADAARARTTRRSPMRFAASCAVVRHRLGGDRRRSVRAASIAPPTAAPRTRFNGTVTAHRVFEARRFDLAEVKRDQGRVPGATVNDAVLAVVGGALRSYLTRQGRAARRAAAWPWRRSRCAAEEQKGTAGNQVSAMMVPLGTTHRRPARAAGRRPRARRRRPRSWPRRSAHARSCDFTAVHPGGPRRARRLGPRASFGSPPAATRRSTRVVTNVPGPQVPLYLAGAKLLSMFGMGPVTDGMGIIHPVFSYNGEIAVSVTACREMMPDPGFYADCLQASFDELAAATADKPKRPQTGEADHHARRQNKVEGTRVKGRTAGIDTAMRNSFRRPHPDVAGHRNGASGRGVACVHLAVPYMTALPRRRPPGAVSPASPATIADRLPALVPDERGYRPMPWEPRAATWARPTHHRRAGLPVRSLPAAGTGLDRGLEPRRDLRSRARTGSTRRPSVR